VFGFRGSIDIDLSVLVVLQVAQLYYGGIPSYNITKLLELLPYGTGSLQSSSIEERNAIQTAFMSSTRLGIPGVILRRDAALGWCQGRHRFPDACRFRAARGTLSLAEAIGRAVAVEAWANGIDRSFSPVSDR